MKLFDDMEKNLDIEFVQGMPKEYKIKAIFDGNHQLICLDDLQHEVANSKEAEKVWEFQSVIDPVPSISIYQCSCNMFEISSEDRHLIKEASSCLINLYSPLLLFLKM